MQRLSALSKLICLTALLPLVVAQSPAWGQCGGNGWTGSTSCVSGFTCVEQNEWYFQCTPGTATTTPPTTTPPATTPSTTSSPVATPGISKYWFSFGDSYTQTGFQPTGVIPAPGNPLGNPPYPGFTATGGENWVDYVTTQYNKSLLLTYNYAYGGATINATLVQPFDPSVLSMTDQVNQFLSGAGTKPTSTPWSSANSLFSFFIGINDIGNSWYQPGDRDAFSDTLLNAYFGLVQEVYNVGARNFLFVNVPPIDRSPLQSSSDQASRDAEAAVITGFNTKLVAKINGFKSASSGVSTYLWDSHTQFTTMLDNPQAYGFKDNSSFGSDPDEFWGNNYHPSSYAHKFFGQTVGNDVLGTTVF